MWTPIKPEITGKHQKRKKSDNLLKKKRILKIYKYKVSRGPGFTFSLPQSSLHPFPTVNYATGHTSCTWLPYVFAGQTYAISCCTNSAFCFWIQIRIGTWEHPIALHWEKQTKRNRIQWGNDLSNRALWYGGIGLWKRTKEETWENFFIKR